MIKIVNGNILDAHEDIICQQVNCMGVMGAGLAKQIRNKYPEVYDAYTEMCGMFSKKKLFGQSQMVKCNDGKYIANIFGQLDYGTNKVQTDYKALYDGLSRVFNAVIKLKQYKGKSIAIPYGIGCGLAGGNWGKVYEIIEELSESYNYDITIYKYK